MVGVHIPQWEKGIPKGGVKKAVEQVVRTIRAKLQLGKFGFDDPKPVPTFKEHA